MEENQININELENKNLIDSHYRFEVLELPKNVSERMHQIKPLSNEPSPKKDELSMLVMIFYSLPAFSKMSCLVILRY